MSQTFSGAAFMNLGYMVSRILVNVHLSETGHRGTGQGLENPPAPFLVPKVLPRVAPAFVPPLTCGSVKIGASF